MDVFSRIIASRLFAWMALISPGVVLLVIPTLNGELGIDPLKELFHRSGEIAVWTLGAVLCLSPLRTLFPRSKIVNAVNRHRRSVGVTAFIYALLHVNLNFIYESGIQSYFASILEPFFLAGTFGVRRATIGPCANWDSRFGNGSTGWLTWLPLSSSITRARPVAGTGV